MSDQKVSPSLDQFTPQHPFLVCIDSDGCVLDSMESKHRHSFIPQTLHHWGLEPLGELAQQAAEFVHLYSQTRGMSRFVLLVHLIDILQVRLHQLGQRFALPNISGVRHFVAEDAFSKSLPGLRAFQEQHPYPELDRAAAWSQAIDADVRQMGDFPIFDGLPDILKSIHQQADVVVISVTPTAQLEQEWQGHHIAQYANRITGQEYGSKAARIQQLMAERYAPDQVLMIGDSPGDWVAAQQNGVLFFPILAGQEVQSWQQFAAEGYPRFLQVRFAGDYAAQLVQQFDQHLPEKPLW